MIADESTCPICLKNEFLEKDFVWMKSRVCGHRMFAFVFESLLEI